MSEHSVKDTLCVLTKGKVLTLATGQNDQKFRAIVEIDLRPSLSLPRCIGMRY